MVRMCCCSDRRRALALTSPRVPRASAPPPSGWFPLVSTSSHTLLGSLPHSHSHTPLRVDSAFYYFFMTLISIYLVPMSGYLAKRFIQVTCGGNGAEEEKLLGSLPI